MKSKEWQIIKEVFNATLDLPENKRAEFLKKYDENLRRAVEKLLNADDEADDFIAEPAFVEVGFTAEDEADFYIGKQVDEYKILEEIGHGGMGTVYLASRRDDFEKRVALKLIKRGMDTNSVLKRFVMERQILARLEHPNIANLLDGGSTDDGLPYLVMEYVEGLPVTKFCVSENLSINERLTLFQKICAAVSYAHQNLVIHRDIKPSNILVSKDGTPKLLDFGIAKLLHPDWQVDTAEATATMFRIMTPEYASPEQIRGLPVTTSSDVYSLGVVLYELLTGERPYKIESRLPEEVANMILTEEPLKPSDAGTGRRGDAETNPQSQISNPKSLRGDLDNIILKALRKEPERRYQSVQEFAEDIRRHLAGLPVTAMADTRFYRIGKFVKRHRAGVSAGVLMLFTILLATSITTWQAIVARREQAKTQQRFNQVRKLANTILFDYHERIKEMPGATEVREKMVTDSLEYLDNLAESTNDTDLQRELALAYRKVGDIQGDVSFGSNVGKTETALISYQKALAIQEKIVAANPTNIEDRRLQARLMIDIAQQHEHSGNLPDSEVFARNAIGIFRQLAEENPNDTKSRSDLSRALWTLATTVRAGGDLDSALAAYRQAAEIYEKLAVEKPEDRKFIRNAALTYKNMGGVFEQKKDFPAALEIYQKALPIDTKNAEDEPNNVTSQMDLAFSYGSIASISFNLERFDESLKNCQKKLAIQEKIVAADAKNAFAQRSLAVTYQLLGNIRQKIKNFDEAYANYQKSIQIFERLSAADPNNAKEQIRLAEGYLLFGEFILNSPKNTPSSGEKSKRLSEAQNLLKKSLNIFQTLKSQNKLDTENEELFAKGQEILKKVEVELAK